MWETTFTSDDIKNHLRVFEIYPLNVMQSENSNGRQIFWV